MKTLWLKKGEDRRIRAGHLWIFSNEIDSAKSPLPDFEPGENATLRDARGAVLGSVFVNPHSLICARLYSRKADLPLDADLLRQRLQSALGLRQRLYNQPWYRLCHGEGDLLPGLVMDRFGDHLTVQVGTWGMEARKEELREVLGELLQPRSILWDNDIAARSLEGLPRENESEGPVPDVLEVPENGCIFRAPLQGGQKTGWFYDQRRNRREAARYAAGADVLDIFCYAGGFGGTAAAAGARSVTFLDASPQALALAMQLLTPGGVFVSCSCSHHLPAESLRSCVQQAAARRKWQARILYAGGQGADHPVHAAMPETAYLKCFIAHLLP